MQVTIVGFGFKARSGKDTIADHLVREHGFRKGSFVQAMKEACRTIFGFNDDQLFGKLKEKVDPFWNERLKIYHYAGGIVPADRVEVPEPEVLETYGEPLPITPRLVMQLMGTEAGRNVFGQDLWVHAFLRACASSGHDRWVVSDVRFPNEANAILAAGGQVYRVDRPGAGATGGAANHPTETALLGYDRWSDVIQNDFTLPDLFRKVEEQVVSKLPKKE
jgi:hypothetical protein